MKEIIKYKCDHCKKSYASKYVCRDHEKECYYAPANKACGSCVYLGYCQSGLKFIDGKIQRVVEFDCQYGYSKPSTRGCPSHRYKFEGIDFENLTLICDLCNEAFVPYKDHHGLCECCIDPF